MGSSSVSDGGAVDPKLTLALYTKTKRAHTRRANKLISLIEQAAPNEEVAVYHENYCLLLRPVLLANLVGVLIQSRETPILVSGDIEAIDA
jgi:hypothetical protein